MNTPTLLHNAEVDRKRVQEKNASPVGDMDKERLLDLAVKWVSISCVVVMVASAYQTWKARNGAYWKGNSQ